ncbi:class I SAM-dependent methyltransferase [Caulobacter sp. S45]|uniref:class I SAM-dependent DNA methyltransferase n=1 Tax=Caulobacter sp. S45 TaxID=1641861 RepID=UPI00157504E5|nr:SAM-dependent methyltransferase [Caulobacter sp. S45]
MRRTKSLDAGYFEAMYRKEADPWKFETSPYEQAKYDTTLAALGDRIVGRVLEVGCSVGVLTARLAGRCGSVLAVDVSETALEAARSRCAGLANVAFGRMGLPNETPSGVFDLILLSEVAYYWDSGDLMRMGEILRAKVTPGGWVLLVHWTGETDYPKTADGAVAELSTSAGEAFELEFAQRTDDYRLDLWRRRAEVECS